jgi:carbon storage regulator CsrA
MLVIARKPNESVAVGGLNHPESLLKVTVLEIGASRVMLGFEADQGVPVHRWEVWERICENAPTGFGSIKKLEQAREGGQARTCAAADGD